MVKQPCWTSILRSVSADITARTLSFSSALSLNACDRTPPDTSGSIGGVTALEALARVEDLRVQHPDGRVPEALTAGSGGAAASAK